ncbi:VanZ family protein [Litoribrevibacter euphylliae]|uniref:VanZ family protein n=1 Tax=Litoribrevibacter euphylliae TaxID=1834034 RepID=A0ABV7HDV2_9GAMM
MTMHFRHKAVMGLVCMVLLIFGTLYQVNQGETYFLVEWLQHVPNGDKIGHLMIFGVLTFMLNLTLLGKSVRLGVPGVKKGVQVNLALLLVGLFAVTEEFSQLYIASRNFDFMDLGCDAVGMAVFYLLSKRVLDKTV